MDEWMKDMTWKKKKEKTSVSNCVHRIRKDLLSLRTSESTLLFVQASRKSDREKVTHTRTGETRRAMLHLLTKWKKKLFFASQISLLFIHRTWKNKREQPTWTVGKHNGPLKTRWWSTSDDDFSPLPWPRIVRIWRVQPGWCHEEDRFSFGNGTTVERRRDWRGPVEWRFH